MVKSHPISDSLSYRSLSTGLNFIYTSILYRSVCICAPLFALIILGYVDSPHVVFEKWMGRLQSFLPERTSERIRGRELISVYVLSNVDIMLSVTNDSDKLYSIEGNPEERRLTYYDEYCGECRRKIHCRERRVLRQRGSVCYPCYRKRVEQRDLYVLLVMKKMFAGVENGLTQITFRFYYGLREEMLVLSNLGHLGQDSFEYIPPLNRFFYHCPSLPVPYLERNELCWNLEEHDEKYYPYAIHLDDVKNEVRFLEALKELEEIFIAGRDKK